MKFILECAEDAGSDESQVTELSFEVNIKDIFGCKHEDEFFEFVEGWDGVENKYATLDFTGSKDSFGYSLYELPKEKDKWDALLAEFKAFFVSKGYIVGKNQSKRIQ